MGLSVERFVLRIMLYVGMAATVISGTVEISTRQELSNASIIDFVMFFVLIISIILYKKDKIAISAVLGIISLLTLMTIEIIDANYIKQGSLAVWMVVSLAISILFKGKFRVFMHVLAASLLATLTLVLHFRGVTLPDGTSLITKSINVTVVYLIIAITSQKLKNMYDGSIKQLNQFNDNLEKEIESRTLELEKYKEALEHQVEARTEKLNEALIDLKETQSQLVQAEKMAALGTLSAGIGHEINNPLNFIRGGYELLTREIEDDEELRDKFQPYLALIDEGTMRAKQITDSLSNFSHNGNGDYRRLDLHEVIDNCLVLMQNLLHESIAVQKNYQNYPLYTVGNLSQMNQVFMNLLLNAVQSIVDNGNIIIHTSTQQDKAKIEIVDTGMGIGEETINKIFEPFFTTKGPGEGTGLGLSISYKIIQDHLGDIQYLSEKGKGTRVVINFPLAKEVPA